MIIIAVSYTHLVGKYVNLEYRLPTGQAAKFLTEAKTSLGNQLECEYGGDRCFGVVADMDFILVDVYKRQRLYSAICHQLYCGTHQ